MDFSPLFSPSCMESLLCIETSGSLGIHAAHLLEMHYKCNDYTSLASLWEAVAKVYGHSYWQSRYRKNLFIDARGIVLHMQTEASARE